MLELREIENKSEYDPLLMSKNAPFTQAWFFGEWQEMIGRKARRLKITKNSKVIGFLQLIEYPLVFSESFLYAPHGPVFREDIDKKSETLFEFSNELYKVGEKEKVAFVRFDPFAGTINNLETCFKKTPLFHYHSSYFQPKQEWILDLEKTEGETLNEMHPKTRYGIRLAENRGVKVEIIKSDFQKHFPNFINLMQKTAERNKFSLHPEIYYKNIFQNCEENKNAFLAIASYDDKIIAMNFVLFYGETVYFIFGASSDELKNLMAPHLLHWKSILEAKKSGCRIYNFGAVGEEYRGVSRFKKSFGGELLEHSDSYDLVLKPFWYLLYNIWKNFNK